MPAPGLDQLEPAESPQAVAPDDFAAATAASALPTERPGDRQEPLPGKRMLSAVMVRVAMIGIFLLGLVGFVYFARSFLLPLAFALVFNFLFKPLVLGLIRFRIPEPLGAAMVLIAFIALGSIAIARLVTPVSEWADRAPENLHGIQQRVRQLMRPAEKLSRAADQVADIASGNATDATPKVQVKTSRLKETVVSQFQGLVVKGVETLVLLYFLLAAGDSFMYKLVRVMPTLRDKKAAVEITRQVQRSISAFLFTTSLINLLFGVTVGVLIWALGMPNPVLWGLTACVLNFIPYIGPLSGVVLFGVAGLMTFDSLGRALLPPLAFLGLHIIEANFITPAVLGQRLTLNPVVIFISLLFWTWIWGVPGALLSIPLLMMLKILADNSPAFAPLSEFLSGWRSHAKASEAPAGEPQPEPGR